MNYWQFSLFVGDSIDSILSIPSILKRSLESEGRRALRIERDTQTRNAWLHRQEFRERELQRRTEEPFKDRQMKVGWNITAEQVQPYHPLHLANDWNPTPFEKFTKEDEFTYLKQLLKYDCWPQAVDPSLIVDKKDKKERQDRAESIVDMVISEPLYEKSFLDFGCGQGDTIEVVRKRRARIAIGYDPYVCIARTLNPASEEYRNTSSFVKNVIIGRYDVILMYDVLDHVQGQSMIDALSFAKKSLTPEGKIYLHCHPWVSRHGGHLYKQLNKAYAHLIFDDNELNRLSVMPEMKTHLISRPAVEYDRIIQEAGLKIVDQHITQQAVDSFFFQDPVVKKRFTAKWPGLQPPQIEKEAGIEFIDYTLVCDFNRV